MCRYHEVDIDWRGIAADRGPDALITLDDTWTVRYCSPVAADRYGLDAAELIGRPLPLDLIHPNDLDYAIGSLVETDRRTGDHVPAQIRIADANGRWHHVEIGARSTVDEASGRRTLVLSIRPIEGRDEPPMRRQALDRLVQRVTSACAAAGTDEIEAVVADSLRDLGEFLHAEAVLLGLVDHERGTLDFGFEWSATPERSWRAVNPGVALADLLWDATKVPERGYVFQGNLSSRTDRKGLAALAAFGVESLVDVVVSSHGRPVAVLSSLFNDDAWFWDDSHASLVRMLAEVLTVTVRRLGDYRKLQYQANHDALTGLANRGHLMRRLREATVPTTLFFCDLDGFKGVNDRWGHEIGDAVLVEVARRISTAVGPDDFVARVGGDEFVVLAQVGDGEPQRRFVAQRIEHAVASLTRAGGLPIAITVSVGYATHRPGEEIEPVLVRADTSMYRTKRFRRQATGRDDNVGREVLVGDSNH